MQKNQAQRTQYLFQVILKKINFNTQIADPKVFVSVQLGASSKNINPRLIRNKFVNFHEIKIDLNCQILSPQSIAIIRIFTLNKNKQTQIGFFNIDLKILARMMNKLKSEKTQLPNLTIQYDLKLIQNNHKEQDFFEKQISNYSAQQIDVPTEQKNKQQLNDHKNLDQDQKGENLNEKIILQNRSKSPQNKKKLTPPMDKYQSSKNKQKQLNDGQSKPFQNNSLKMNKKNSANRQGKQNPKINSHIQSQYDFKLDTQKNLMKKKVSFVSQTQKSFQIKEQDKIMKHQINQLKSHIKQKEQEITKIDLVIMICLALFSFIAGSLIRQI